MEGEHILENALEGKNDPNNYDDDNNNNNNNNNNDKNNNIGSASRTAIFITKCGSSSLHARSPGSRYLRWPTLGNAQPWSVRARTGIIKTVAFLSIPPEPKNVFESLFHTMRQRSVCLQG